PPLRLRRDGRARARLGPLQPARDQGRSVPAVRAAQARRSKERTPPARLLPRLRGPASPPPEARRLPLRWALPGGATARARRDRDGAEGGVVVRPPRLRRCSHGYVEQVQCPYGCEFERLEPRPRDNMRGPSIPVCAVCDVPGHIAKLCPATEV